MSCTDHIDHPHVMIYFGRSTPDLYDLYGLARVAVWKPYNQHVLAHVS